MIVEVNEAGEILIPAALVQAPPQTRLQAEREGPWVVLKPVSETLPAKEREVGRPLPVFPGRVADPGMTFRREDIYDPDAR